MSSLGLVLLAGGSTTASERMMENSGGQEGADPGNGCHLCPWPRDVDATAPRIEDGRGVQKSEAN